MMLFENVSLDNDQLNEEEISVVLHLRYNPKQEGFAFENNDKEIYFE